MRNLYLDLMKRVLTGMAYEDAPIETPWLPDGEYNEQRRYEGYDWPSHAPTMLGVTRLDNIQYCAEQVIADGVPGDFLEAGIWRGGACIFMRAILRAHEVTDRKVWAADSFQGLPPVDDCGSCGTPADQHTPLAVSRDEVEKNFRLYGMLDDQVGFIPGWFKDSLPGPVGQLAVLRMDGDRYESQRDVLRALYPKLSPGGFVIIDDYHFPECARAVHEYRDAHAITTPIEVMLYGAWWRKDA